MRKRVTRRSALPLGLLALVAMVAVAVAAAPNAASRSTKLHGKMLDIANFGGPGCGSATGICSRYTVTGDLKGTGITFVETFPTPGDPGTPQATIAVSRAHTIITTKRGELHCSEAAIFDLAGADHAFVDLCVITGGTGDYAGATGYIQEVGTFDFAANRGQLEYFGKLVLATS